MSGLRSRCGKHRRLRSLFAYILGEVILDRLHLQPECHIRCHPEMAQFILDSRFEPVICLGGFAKEHLDGAFVAAEEKRVTQAWRRLQAIPTLGLTLAEYPIAVTPVTRMEEGE